MDKNKANKSKIIEQKQAQEVIKYVEEHELTSINKENLREIKKIIFDKNLKN